jgi:hypothetical protein
VKNQWIETKLKFDLYLGQLVWQSNVPNIKLISVSKEREKSPEMDNSLYFSK